MYTDSLDVPQASSLAINSAAIFSWNSQQTRFYACRAMIVDFGFAASTGGVFTGTPVLQLSVGAAPGAAASVMATISGVSIPNLTLVQGVRYLNTAVRTHPIPIPAGGFFRVQWNPAATGGTASTTPFVIVRVEGNVADTPTQQAVNAGSLVLIGS